MAVRSLCLVLLACLGACPGEVPPRDEEDAPIATPDAKTGTPDAKTGAPDAGIADARIADAPSVGPDAPACTITGGVMGVCIDKTLCLSMPGHKATAGFCPGPANIQCCTLQ